MTIEEAKSRLLRWAANQVGYHEGENNYNRYAESTDLQRLYGWRPQNQPWCDIFVDAGFIECFGLELASRLTYQPVGHGSAACRYSAGFYSANEAFYSAPQVGDQAFFFCDGGINHTGIVESISGHIVNTIEGNSSDRVSRNAYLLGSSIIAGYGRPNWAAVIGEDPAPEDPQEDPEKPSEPVSEYCDYTYKVETHLLKKGNRGAQVKNMQILLNGHGFDCGKADGVFGDNTYNALRRFQEAAKIGVDGEWGGESFKAAWNYGG